MILCWICIPKCAFLRVQIPEEKLWIPVYNIKICFPSFRHIMNQNSLFQIIRSPQKLGTLREDRYHERRCSNCQGILTCTSFGMMSLDKRALSAASISACTAGPHSLGVRGARRGLLAEIRLDVTWTSLHVRLFRMSCPRSLSTACAYTVLEQKLAHRDLARSQR